MGGPGPPAAHGQTEQPEPPREQGLLCGRVHSEGTCLYLEPPLCLCVLYTSHTRRYLGV